MEERKPASGDELDHVVKDLSEVGRVWAKYGLGVGKTALEASASTLRTTASILGRITEHLEQYEPTGRAKDEEVE